MQLENEGFMQYFEYRSVSDMDRIIISKLYVFPHDIDLIVGIPRSGMLPANLLALYLNKPYTDIDSFLDGRIYASGGRGKYFTKKTIQKVLIVDDLIASGRALNEAKKKLKTVSYQYIIQYCAIYAQVNVVNLVDYYCEKINYGIIVFQWNIFLYPNIIDKACFDIDGVLCVNPPCDDDGLKYLNYITNAIPLYLPMGEINTLVTCRLEKYKNVTEMWLRKWNIKYKHLIMLDLKTKDDRDRWGEWGKWKGKIYKKSECILFIESSLNEALDIKNISNKPVFCIETFSMMNTNIGKIKKSIIGKLKLTFFKYFRKLYKSIKSRLLEITK
jgi:uncharacterized HAD superfamily protein/hypoxanthine phosphoribosyltransferase